jgi:alginate O-acetyltransferase complex protein AlgI
MLFHSNEFLFIFLPLVLICFHSLRVLQLGQLSFGFLLVASLLFYAHWSVIYCLLFIASITINFLLAKVIMKTKSAPLTAVGVTANLILLGYFKYTNFFIDLVNQAQSSNINRLEVVLPIGISFYTFIQIAFLVDVYRGTAREPHPLRYGLFVSFFPHMLAGPIVHHREMMPQFSQSLPQYRLERMLATGALLLVIGLAKKVLIADRLALLANPVFERAISAPIDFFTAWIGVLAYTFQLYFDFSGYSDMAIGIALMFGIRFPANFNSPYQSRSIIAFWRRWHMTLSRLLRDYIYIPLGGSRAGDARRYVNLMVTMLIGGAWHGAGWTFILWGGLHGLFLTINHLWNQHVGRSLGAAAAPLTFAAVALAWVPFRAADLPTSLGLWSSLSGLNGLSAPLELDVLLRRLGLSLQDYGVLIIADNQRIEYYSSLTVLLIAMILAFFAPNSLQLTRRYAPVLDIRSVISDSPSLRRFLLRPNLVSGALAGFAFFLVARTINSVAVSEFLYFQF